MVSQILYVLQLYSSVKDQMILQVILGGCIMELDFHSCWRALVVSVDRLSLEVYHAVNDIPSLDYVHFLQNGNWSNKLK